PCPSDEVGVGIGVVHLPERNTHRNWQAGYLCESTPPNSDQVLGFQGVRVIWTSDVTCPIGPRPRSPRCPRGTLLGYSTALGAGNWRVSFPYLGIPAIQLPVGK